MSCLKNSLKNTNFNLHVLKVKNNITKKIYKEYCINYKNPN